MNDQLVADPAYLRELSRALLETSHRAEDDRLDVRAILSDLARAGAGRAPGWVAIEEDLQQAVRELSDAAGELAALARETGAYAERLERGEAIAETLPAPLGHLLAAAGELAIVVAPPPPAFAPPGSSLPPPPAEEVTDPETVTPESAAPLSPESQAPAPAAPGDMEAMGRRGHPVSAAEPRPAPVTAPKPAPLPESPAPPLVAPRPSVSRSGARLVMRRQARPRRHPPAAPQAPDRSIWNRITGLLERITDGLRSWLVRSLGEVAGGLLFGAIQALAVVLVAAAALAALAAGLAAAGVGLPVAAVVAGAIGLAMAIPLAVRHRLQDYRGDHPGEGPGPVRGAALVLLGMGDLTGIPYVVEGLAGRRAFGARLAGPSRWERVGMGAVFLAAMAVTAKNLLRPRPRVEPPEPPGRIPEAPRPRPAAAPPAGMSPTLQRLRASLRDPRAVEQLDDQFVRLRGDSAAQERIVEGFERGTGAEERLIRDWEHAHPAPHGPALAEASGLHDRTRVLRAEAEAYLEANPQVGDEGWLARLNEEVRSIDRMLTGRNEATMIAVQSRRNNVNGLEAELRSAARREGVVALRRHLPAVWRGERIIMEADVVARWGRELVEVKRVSPFTLQSTAWKGGSKIGLAEQAARLVEAARQNPIEGVPADVVIEFPIGVFREVAEALTAMGARVEGPIVDAAAVLPVPLTVVEEEGANGVRHR